MGNIFSISLSLDSLVPGCWNCFAAQANLVCKLQKNCRALESEREKLMGQKNHVKTKVRLAEEEGLAPLEHVTSWISSVEDAEVDINQLIEDGPQEIERLCLGGCCSTSLKSSYIFGRKLVQKLDDVASLRRDGVFEAVAERVPLAPVQPRGSENTVGMESTFDKVWSCLEQEDVGIIGLYGLGGVGKTTLLTKINNHFPSDSGFVIIWVVVSKDLNLQKIQDGIWKRLRSLDDSWKQKSQDEKADEIHTVLCEKKFVLLLDDIWEQVDLKEVGVPLPNKANKSKIVFTTRFKDVCGLMDAHPKIKVKCLSWEKAWELFQQKVGDDHVLRSDPDIRKLAENVAKECDGLPLALITIGRAMACKNTTQQWKYALDILKSSASKFTGMTEKVFARLKFTFDSLQNDAYRSCFLYCALFPEDFCIAKDELLNYWIGEGYIGEYNEIEEARNEAYEIMGTLLNACLLEEGSEEKEEGVKLHDMVRDMALWIVSENEKEKKDYFLVQAGAGLTKAPEIKKWEGAKKISFMMNKIGELTKTTSCPNLTTLFLSNNNLTEIADGFFDHMSNLRVLDLSRNWSMLKVPLGISKLVSLQYLNLSSTGITQLPIELRSLVNLKYLDLSCTTNLEMIPRWLISSFLKLQVCHIFGCFRSPLDVEDNVLSRGNEGLLEELEGLQNLQWLGITIESESALQRYFRSNKLQSCTRDLFLYNIQSLTVLNISCLQNVKHLVISWVKNVEELEIDWKRGGRGEIEATNDPLISTIRSKRLFLSLRQVSIEHCTELRDVTWLVFAPNITRLRLFDCNEMEEVINVEKLGESPEDAANLNPFSQLKFLELDSLPRLKSIYPSVLPFPHLIQIFVIDCPYLKRLPLNSNSAEGRKITIGGEQLWWDELEWEDEATPNALHFLPW